MMINLLRYEWIRFKSLRSSWIWLVVICLFVALPGFGGAYDSGTHDIAGIYQNAFSVLGTLLAIFAIVFTANEYRHNTIRGLLVASNKRGQVFTAKLGFLFELSVVYLLLAILVASVAALVASNLKHGNVEFSSYTTVWFWRDVGRGLLYSWMFVALGMSLAKIFRDTVAPIVTFLVTPIFIENIVTALTRNAHWTTFLPFRAADQMLLTADRQEFIKYGATFLVYCLVLIALAYYSLTKKDIT